MTTISPTISSSIMEQHSFESIAEPTVNKELGQAEFLELMMEQLKNQDPMEPTDNGEFLGQMAQFSTVSGIEEMQQSLEKLSETYASGQTLQSSQLIGQTVLVENSTMELSGENTINGSFELEASSGEVTLDISDSSGKIIRQIGLGEYNAGRHGFTWDGIDNNGDSVPSGQYTASITAKIGDTFQSVTVLNSRTIESVEFGAGGQTTLNTKQGDVITMADIREIRHVE